MHIDIDVSFPIILFIAGLVFVYLSAFWRTTIPRTQVRMFPLGSALIFTAILLGAT